MHPNIEHSIDASAGIVRLVYAGDATFEEWASALETIFSDATYRPGFNFLVDRRRASAPKPDDLRRMVVFIDEHMALCRDSRWAIITYSLADYGMGRMAQVLASDHPTVIEIFTEPDQGLHWLQERPRSDAG
jgi:hypothetical protein